MPSPPPPWLDSNIASNLKNKKARIRFLKNRSGLFVLVEHSGFEPLTSTLPVWRSPN